MSIFFLALFFPFSISLSFAFFPFFYPVLRVRIKALASLNPFYIFQIYSFQNISQFSA